MRDLSLPCPRIAVFDQCLSQDADTVSSTPDTVRAGAYINNNEQALDMNKIRSRIVVGFHLAANIFFITVARY